MNEPNVPNGTPDPGSQPGPTNQPSPTSSSDPAAVTPEAHPAPTDVGADAAQRAEDAVAGAEQAVRKISEAVAQVSTPDMPDLSEVAGADGTKPIGLLSDVELDVRIELGRTRMLVEDVLRLSSDAVVELDKAAGDPVDIYVNGRRIARGEVLVLNENFCVRVSEIVDPQARTA